MIRLRAHHGLCILNFMGKGYDEDFINHMKRIINRLQSGEDITIIDGCDDICSCCPHHQNGICDSANPAVFDENVKSILPRDHKDWSTLSAFLQSWNNENLEWICRGCSWLFLCTGINRSRQKEQD